MARHHTEMVRLGWAGYLGFEKGLVKCHLLGRYPVRVQSELVEGVAAIHAALVGNGYENPTDFIGSYMYRKIGGTDIWSEHAYGTALDIDYGGDTDGDGDPTIDKNPHIRRRIVPGDPGFGVEWQFTESDIAAIENIRNTHGEQMWSWLGWDIGDTMHVSTSVRPDRAVVDWTTVGGHDMAWDEWVTGLVTGWAEDPVKTESEFVRLASEGKLGGSIQYWMNLLDTPTDPAWRGFVARTWLSSW